MALDLSALPPLEAFSALKGIASRSLKMAPIAPIIRVDTNDPRFVDAKEVLSRMAEGENLAAMDWEHFEHLCRELFERAFAGSGAEVKVTQASRDHRRRLAPNVPVIRPLPGCSVTGTVIASGRSRRASRARAARRAWRTFISTICDIPAQPGWCRVGYR